MTRRLSEDLVELWRAIDEATVGDGAFASGPAVWVGKREVAHIDVDGSVDSRLTRQAIRARRSELEGHERVSLRGSASDWLEVTLETDDDVELAISLVRDAVAASALESARARSVWRSVGGEDRSPAGCLMSSAPGFPKRRL